MASSPQHEPTMEEILASIRKIISEDSTEAPAAVETPAAAAPAAVTPSVAATPAPTVAPAPAADNEEEEILDLTEEVHDEPAPAPVAAAPKDDDIVFQTIEEPKPLSGNDIFSDTTRRAIDDAFAKLDSEEDTRETAPASAMAPAFKSTSIDGDSVEAVFERAVRDAVGPHIDQWMSAQKGALLVAMKPLIREWMDEHFPSILEGAVRDEVARAVKARGKR
jgi:cell pole-organizing protein PopZ